MIFFFDKCSLDTEYAQVMKREKRILHIVREGKRENNQLGIGRNLM